MINQRKDYVEKSNEDIRGDYTLRFRGMEAETRNVYYCYDASPEHLIPLAVSVLQIKALCGMVTTKNGNQERNGKHVSDVCCVCVMCVFVSYVSDVVCVMLGDLCGL